MTSVLARGVAGMVLLLAGCGPSGQRGPAGPVPPAEAVPVEVDHDGPGGDDDGDNDGGQGDPTADELRIAAIEDAVNSTLGARHECWAFAAADDYRLTGEVVLGLSFGSADTAAVEVLSDTAGDARLVACLRELYGAYRWPSVFEPGQSIELPLSFKAPQGQYTIAARYVDPSEHAGGKLAVWVLLDEANTGNGAASLALLSMKDGMEVPLHRHGVAEVLYVHSGEGVVYGLGTAGKGTRVGPGHAIYIPAGTAHGFTHKGSEPMVMVQVYTPAGPEKGFTRGAAAGATAGTTPVPPSERAGVRGVATPIVVKKPEVFSMAGGAGSLSLYFDEARTGDRSAYLGIFSAQPGTVVPAHRHETSTEILLVLEGGGTMTVAGEPYPVAPMTAIQVPSNIEHAFTVESAEPVRAVQLYTPAGPEQRFKQSR